MILSDTVWPNGCSVCAFTRKCTLFVCFVHFHSIIVVLFFCNSHSRNLNSLLFGKTCLISHFNRTLRKNKKTSTTDYDIYQLLRWWLIETPQAKRYLQPPTKHFVLWQKRRKCSKLVVRKEKEEPKMLLKNYQKDCGVDTTER